MSNAVSAIGGILVEEPSMESWAIRGYREEDIAGLVTLINAANTADGVEKRTSVEELTRDFAMPLSDPLTQVLVAEANGGEFAGYSRVVSLEDSEQGERLYQFVLKVHPDARNKGLEEALATRLMGMIRNHNGEASRAQVEKVSVISNTRIENTAMRGLIEKMGLRDIRHGWIMERSLNEALAEPSAVEGVTIRGYRQPADNIAAHEAYGNSFIDHFEYHALPQEFWDYMVERPEVRLDLSWLAEVDDEPGRIAGFCICEIKENDNEHTGRKEGWIELLGTVRGWRNKGLGRSLLLRGMRSLKEAGMDTALLGVDSESPTGANRLYESVGFTVRYHDVVYKCDLSEVTL